MALEWQAGGTSLIDVLDRVLDKGVVIDDWVRTSQAGIDLSTVEARVVVASIDTYRKYSEAIGGALPVARPKIGEPSGGTSGAPAFAGDADILPRALPSRHRRPLD